MATGREYNVSQRWGPTGVALFRDLLKGNKGLAETLMGPSGSVIASTIKSMHPLINGVTSIFSGNSDTFPVMMEDFADAASEWSTLSTGTKAWIALNTNKFVSKNEVYLADVDKWDVFVNVLTGLTPQDVPDTFTMIQSMKDQKTSQDEIKKMIIKEYRRGLEAGAKEDDKGFNSHMKRVKASVIAGGFDPTQEAQIMAEANKGYESLAERIKVEFWQKAMVNQRTPRMERFISEKQKALKRNAQ